MALVGARTAVDLVTPTGIDAAKVFEFEVLRQKKTALQLIQEMAAGIGFANQFILDKYGSMITFTEDMFAIDRVGDGTRAMTEEGTEFSDPDPRRSDHVGHMLPLRTYKDTLGWTEKYLRRATSFQTTGDVNEIADAWVNRMDFEIITRILTNTENQIGSAGYDVGWAIGAAQNVNFIPPQWRSTIFTSAHTHYVVKNSSTPLTFADLFEEMVEELRHHGIRGRFAILTSEADFDTIFALGNFVQLVPPEVVISGGTTSPKFTTGGEFEGIPGDLYGYFLSKRGLVGLFSHDRIPTGYAFGFRPGSQGSVGNALAIRLEPGEPFGLIPDVQVTPSVSSPRLAYVKFEGFFGTGVLSRLRGVAGYLAAGATTWVNPTIT